jgi:hypothetical protein
MAFGSAVKPVTREVLIPGGGVVSLVTILGRDPKTWMGSVAFRAARGNADDVFWADEDAGKGGFIGPGEAVSFDFGEGQALIQNFNLSGQAGDTVYVTAGLNRHYFTSDQ